MVVGALVSACGKRSRRIGPLVDRYSSSSVDLRSLISNVPAVILLNEYMFNWRWNDV